MGDAAVTPLTDAQVDLASRIAPPHMRPLFRAMKLAGIGVIIINRDAPSMMFHGASLTGTVAIIGDDTDRSCGPSAFNATILRELFSFSAAICIHGAAPDEGTYAAMAALASAGGVAALIETQTAHEMAWLGFVEREAPRHVPVSVISVKPAPSSWTHDWGCA